MFRPTPEIAKKTLEILNKTLDDYKERAILVCQDKEQFVDKEITGTGMHIHYPKGWHTCSRGKPVASIHTHASLNAFSIQDLRYAGKKFMEFDNFTTCIAYRSKDGKTLDCITHKNTASKAREEYLEQREEEIRKQRKGLYSLLPTEVSYLDRLQIKRHKYILEGI